MQNKFKIPKEIVSLIEDLVMENNPYAICGSMKDAITSLIDYFSDDDIKTIQEEYEEFIIDEVENKNKNYIIKLETFVKREYGDRIYKYNKLFFVDYNNNFSESDFNKLCEISGAKTSEELLDFCNKYYENN